MTRVGGRQTQIQRDTEDNARRLEPRLPLLAWQRQRFDWSAEIDAQQFHSGGELLSPI